MRLYKDGTFVEDRWLQVAEDAPLPRGGRIVVSLARWRAERTALLAPDFQIGLRLQPAEIVLGASDRLDRLALVTLPFPKFTDGRAYSTARRLRETLGYGGELRATGDVLFDQMPLMLRAGFDAFEVSHAPTIRALEAGLLRAPLIAYQPPLPAA